eukprot:129710_1
MGKCVTKVPNEINQSLPQNTIPINKQSNETTYDILSVKNITVAQNEPIKVSWNLSDINYTSGSCWIGLIPHTIINTDERSNENETVNQFIVYQNKGKNILTTSKVGIYYIKCFSSDNIGAAHITTFHSKINVLKEKQHRKNNKYDTNQVTHRVHVTDLLSVHSYEKELRTDFMKSMSKYNAQILSIDKIKQSEINNKIFDNILNIKSNPKWQYLYYGTSFEGAKKIIINGFNREYNKHTKYGYGTYLSSDASISSQHCIRYNKTTAVYCMLICKTLIGDCVQGYNDMKQITLIKADGYTRYDSIVDDINNPHIFVINKDYHSIPTYLITFKYLSDERRTLLETHNVPNSVAAHVQQDHNQKTQQVKGEIPFDVVSRGINSCHGNIKSDFIKSMKHYDAQIIDVYRIKNATKKKKILKSICDSDEKTFCQNLYHGTSFKNLKSIIINGFNRDYNQRSRYGYGTYATSEAIIASQYCARYDRSTAIYCMFVCKTLIGPAMKGYQNINKSTMVKKDGYTQVDLLVDKLDKPQIFVINRDYHCIPTHLIVFKYLSDKRKKKK